MAATSGRCLSPRLAALCGDHEEIRRAILENDLVNTQDLGSFAPDADVASQRLRLSEPSRAVFTNIFAITKARSEGTDEERVNMVLDVLNGEGQIILKRPRGDVHKHGMWHRAVNVWVICTKTSRVLLGQRAVSKDTDPRRWTCVCGRVPSGELSMSAALERLIAEFSIEVEPDSQLSLCFTMKCAKPITKGIFTGQDDGAWMDVYVATLEEEIPVETLQLDARAKQAAKYISIADFQAALESGDDNYVIPPKAEYTKKLFHYLRSVCQAPGYKPWHSDERLDAPPLPKPPVPIVTRPRALLFN
jgi:isopentenyldiphosphate isomerase